jgi:hypothetical protein
MLRLINQMRNISVWNKITKHTLTQRQEPQPINSDSSSIQIESAITSSVRYSKKRNNVIWPGPLFTRSYLKTTYYNKENAFTGRQNNALIKQANYAFITINI